MIAKLLGSPLLLAGICLLHQALTSPRKSRICALSELSQALSFLARGVQARIPMPRLLSARGFGTWGDGFFAAVYESAFVKGEAMGSSWRASVKALPLNEMEKEELCAIGGLFDGNAKELGVRMEGCAKTYHALWQKAQSEQREKQKTESSVVLCAALLVIILLF